MPRWGRTSESADRAEQWSAWVKPLLDASGKSGAQIERDSANYTNDPDRMISRDLVSKWRRAVQAATPDNALMIARILKADPVEALHAAGHDYLIADIIGIVKAHDAAKARGEDLVEKYRTYVAEDRDTDNGPETRDGTG